MPKKLRACFGCVLIVGGTFALNLNIGIFQMDMPQKCCLRGQRIFGAAAGMVAPSQMGAIIGRRGSVSAMAERLKELCHFLAGTQLTGLYCRYRQTQSLRG